MRTRQVRTLVLVLTAAGALMAPLHTWANTVVMLKGRTIRENILPSMIPVPDGQLLLASDIITASWGIGFRDDDVLVRTLPGGAMFRYGDFAPMTLDAFAESFAHELLVYDPVTESFAAYAGSVASLSDILDQAGSLVVLDSRLGALPPGTLSLNDADADGASNAVDNCPSDPAKTEPGVCGCGVADRDNDGNGVADCLDSSVTPTVTPTFMSPTPTPEPSTPTPSGTAAPTVVRTATHAPAGTGTPTGSATQSATATASKTPTATPTPTREPCVGACSVAGEVTVVDLLKLVNIWLDLAPRDTCSAGNPSGGPIGTQELIAALDNLLIGCPSE